MIALDLQAENSEAGSRLHPNHELGLNCYPNALKKMSSFLYGEADTDRLTCKTEPNLWLRYDILEVTGYVS